MEKPYPSAFPAAADSGPLGNVGDKGSQGHQPSQKLLTVGPLGILVTRGPKAEQEAES